jgi:hypothetical protein
VYEFPQIYVIGYHSIPRINIHGRSNSKDYPDKMVAMVPPFGSKHVTIVFPSLGKKMSRGRRKHLISDIGSKKIIFQPRIQNLNIAASKEDILKPGETLDENRENRMYNFTEFEDDKNKHHQVTPSATPHLTKADSIDEREDVKKDSNKTVDKDLKILFKNLDPEPQNGTNRGYVIDNSRLVIKSRLKRGVNGSPASEHSANHDKYCGGTFRGLSGIIKSPNYPLYYPDRKHCVYDIEVPDGNDYTIKFTCDDFGLQGTQVSFYRN